MRMSFPKALFSSLLMASLTGAALAQSAESLLNQGEQLFNAGNFAAAAEKFEQARRQAP